MDPPELLAALIDLAEALGIEIRRAPPGTGSSGGPAGALVRLKGKEILFLDPIAAVPDQISVVAGALAGRAELQDRFLPPKIRQCLDEASEEA
jgi:hypothetical protein